MKVARSSNKPSELPEDIPSFAFWLDEVKVRKACHTDSLAAEYLGVTPSTFSSWRTRKSCPEIKDIFNISAQGKIPVVLIIFSYLQFNASHEERVLLHAGYKDAIKLIQMPRRSTNTDHLPLELIPKIML